jgi:alpha-ketoglutarate-dependent taurine dioxygenase
MMDKRQAAETSFERFKTKKPSALKLSTQALVQNSYLRPEQTLPLVMQPGLNNVDLVQWSEQNNELIERALLAHGAILFRGFGISTAERFEQFASAISSDLLEYHERAAPRTKIGDNVYTSTEFPPDQIIPLHHEMSYSHNWPSKVFFCCELPAQEGGRTPLADDRKVFQLLDPKIKERFMRLKVMYVRNYGEGVDLSWEEAFQTTERAVVEEYCRQAHTEFEWKDNNRLRTRHVRQAVAVHPKTGEMVWFNHAHMFHVSSLEQSFRESLLEAFRDDELPRNAFYGDGSPIETSVLDEIRETYQDAAITFPWEKGDVLLVDNFLVSHGRESYVGPRKILVVLTDLYTNTNL